MQWSSSIVDLATGEPLFERGAQLSLSTASIGKLLLLIEVADGLRRGELDPAEPLDRRSVDEVADSGLWQHLATDVLPLADVAALVGAVSDNLATNVLLHRVGLDAVQRWPRRLGLEATNLHDCVRDARGPEHPERLSSGSAAELARLMWRLQNAFAGDQVLRWLAAGVDLSLVAAAFGLDPLAPHPVLVNKTGTDAGVRADVGIVRGQTRSVAYAVIANWPPEEPQHAAVLHEMRLIGEQLLRTVV